MCPQPFVASLFQPNSRTTWVAPKFPMRRFVAFFLFFIFSFGAPIRAEETVPLKNGLTETGTIFNLPSLNENAFAAAGGGVISKDAVAPGG